MMKPLLIGFVAVFALSKVAVADTTHCASLPTRLLDAPGSTETFQSLGAVAKTWVEAEQRRRDIPGVAVGWVVGDSLAWSAASGVESLESQVPVSEDSVFRIASVTKTFTGTAILALRDAGRLHLDDPITKHIPAFDLEGYERERDPIRLSHLLTHSSGVPRDSALSDWNSWSHPPAEAALRALPGQEITFPPGSGNHYSNLGFGLLGLVIEVVSGQSYADYIDTTILQPLGMGDTTVIPDADDYDTTGYFSTIDGRRRAAKHIELNFQAPSGSIASSLRDMAKYVAFSLRCTPEETGPPLRRGSIEEMQRVHYPVNAGDGSGLAWAVRELDGERRVYHSGGLPSQTSHVNLLPDAGMGVIALTNAQDGNPGHFTETVLGILRAGIRQACGPAQLSAKEMSAFAGRYSAGAPEEEIWAVPVGGRLALIAPESSSPMGEMMCLSHLEANQFDITSGFGEYLNGRFEERDGTMYFIAPTFSFERLGSLPE